MCCKTDPVTIALAKHLASGDEWLNITTRPDDMKNNIHDRRWKSVSSSDRGLRESGNGRRRRSLEMVT
jgi:hypothetical protein